MSKSYVVTGAYVTAEVQTDAGAQVRGFATGATLPDGIATETIEHLLDVNLITEVNADADLKASEALTGQYLGDLPADDAEKKPASKK